MQVCGEKLYIYIHTVVPIPMWGGWFNEIHNLVGGHLPSSTSLVRAPPSWSVYSMFIHSSSCVILGGSVPCLPKPKGTTWGFATVWANTALFACVHLLKEGLEGNVDHFLVVSLLLALLNWCRARLYCNAVCVPNLLIFYSSPVLCVWWHFLQWRCDGEYWSLYMYHVIMCCSWYGTLCVNTVWLVQYAFHLWSAIVHAVWVSR